MSFPNEVIVSPGQTVPVIHKPLDGKLGYFDPTVPEIALEETMTNAEKHHILLHEIIHLASGKIAAAGLAPLPPEEYVTYLTGTLFPMLALSGLWSGVTKEEVTEFLSTPDREPAEGMDEEVAYPEVTLEAVTTFIMEKAEEESFAISKEQIEYVYDAESLYMQRIGIMAPEPIGE